MAGVVAIATLSTAGCVGDPDGNPIVDITSTCQAHSQNHTFFGEAFSGENQSAREALADFFRALSDHDEPSLACGSEPDEAYRLTIVRHYPPVPLLIRVERTGPVARIAVLHPRADVASYRYLPSRVERQLNADEWARLVSVAEATDLANIRAIPVPGRPFNSDYSSLHRLLEFRRRGGYGLVYRPALRAGDALDPLTRQMIRLAGTEYPWFE